MTTKKEATAAVAKTRKKVVPVIEEETAEFWEDTDYEIHESYLGQNQAVVVFSQEHGGSVGSAIIGIMTNIIDGKVQQLITDTNQQGIRYYTLLIEITSK
jgi:hypothetical protein